MFDARVTRLQLVEVSTGTACLATCSGVRGCVHTVLLADALDLTARAAITDAISGRDEGASDLASFALPATLCALSHSPPLECMG